MRAVVAGCKTDERLIAGGVRASFRFPAELEVFDGHFPGLPLVPGVFLIEAVRLAAESVAAASLEIREIASAKFTAEVGPGDALEVDAEVAREGETWTCRATVRRREEQAARMHLRLVEVAPGGG